MQQLLADTWCAGTCRRKSCAAVYNSLYLVSVWEAVRDLAFPLRNILAQGIRKRCGTAYLTVQLWQRWSQSFWQLPLPFYVIVFYIFCQYRLIFMRMHTDTWSLYFWASRLRWCIIIYPVSCVRSETAEHLFCFWLFSRIEYFLDFVLHYSFTLGMYGAAIATVMAQAVSAVLCLFFIRKKMPLLWLEKENRIMQRNKCVSF